MNKIKLLILAIFNIFMFITSCSQEISHTKKKITLNVDSVYWDTEIGVSWYINKNATALWYQYKNNERYLTDFGDVIIDHFNWKINHDTIFFYADNAVKPMAKYQILNINDSIMSVCDIGKYGNNKIIVFKYSKNQYQKPKASREYEIYKLDSDTLKHIYPVKE